MGGTFDPVSEARKRWPDLAGWDDTRILANLRDPVKFRSAFPEYAQLDDETISRNMAQYQPGITPVPAHEPGVPPVSEPSRFPSAETWKADPYAAALKTGEVALKTPLAAHITGEPPSKFAEHYLPPKEVGGVKGEVADAVRIASQFADFLTSPEGLATVFATAATGGAAGPFIGAGYAAQMTPEVYEAAKVWKADPGNPDKLQQFLLAAGLVTGLTAGAAGEAPRLAKPKLAPGEPEFKPLTAREVGGTIEREKALQPIPTLVQHEAEAVPAPPPTSEMVARGRSLVEELRRARQEKEAAEEAKRAEVEGARAAEQQAAQMETEAARVRDLRGVSRETPEQIPEIGRQPIPFTPEMRQQLSRQLQAENLLGEAERAKEVRAREAERVPFRVEERRPVAPQPGELEFPRGAEEPTPQPIQLNEGVASVAEAADATARRIASEHGLSDLIDQVYVVGSRAAGKARRVSDVDLLVKLHDVNTYVRKSGKFDSKLQARVNALSDALEDALGGGKTKRVQDVPGLGKVRIDAFVEDTVTGKAVPLAELRLRLPRGAEEPAPLVPQFAPTPKIKRTYETVQKDIDRLEDELVAQGKPVETMTPELERLYAERDAIGAGELEESTRAIQARLREAGIPEGEIRTVLEEYRIVPGKTGAVRQTFAIDAPKIASRDPRTQIENVALTLAVARGQGKTIDTIADLRAHPDVVRDAAKAVRAVMDYFDEGSFERAFRNVRGAEEAAGAAKVGKSIPPPQFAPIPKEVKPSVETKAEIPRVAEVPSPKAAKGALPIWNTPRDKYANPSLRVKQLSDEEIIQQRKQTGKAQHWNAEKNEVVISKNASPESVAHEVAHSYAWRVRQGSIWASAIDDTPRANAALAEWNKLPGKRGMGYQPRAGWKGGETNPRNYDWRETSADIVADYMRGRLPNPLKRVVEEIGSEDPALRRLIEHRRTIEEAISREERIPAEVLKDYPDLERIEKTSVVQVKQPAGKPPLILEKAPEVKQAAPPAKRMMVSDTALRFPKEAPPTLPEDFQRSLSRLSEMKPNVPQFRDQMRMASIVGQRAGLKNTEIHGEILKVLGEKAKEKTRGEIPLRKIHTINASELKSGDAFLDAKGEPRFVQRIENGVVYARDGNVMKIKKDGKVRIIGEINDPRAQIAMGGKVKEVPGARELEKHAARASLFGLEQIPKALRSILRRAFPEKPRSRTLGQLSRQEVEEFYHTRARALEPRLKSTIAKEIGLDVPLEVVHRMKPREQQRVMFQIAELIQDSPQAIPRVPELLKEYELTPAQLADYLRDSASKAGQTLGSFGWIGRELMKVKEFKDPAVQKALGKFAHEPPGTLSWQWMMDKFSSLENIRLALMVSQLKTSVRNAYTQAAHYGLHTLEDAAQGVFEKAKGKETGPAFARMVDDLYEFRRVVSPDSQKQLDQILKQMPVHAERLTSSPLADINIGSKLARMVSAHNRFVEIVQRRMVFDAVFRGELGTKGYKVRGMPETWWDQVKPEDRAAAADTALDAALRVTFARPLRSWFIGTLYKKFPLLRLVQPFPRFFFGNAMKFIFDYSPAAFLHHKTWKAFKAGDVRLLTRAAEGTVMLAAATAYRAQDDSPGRWYAVKVKGKEIDTRPFAPLVAPYLFLGEVILDIGRSKRGEPTRLNTRDYLAGLIGLNRIAGTGLAIVDSLFEGRQTIQDKIRTLKEVAGGYVGSFTVPILMLKDVVAHFDDEEKIYRSVRGDEFLGPVKRNIPYLSRTLPPSPSLTHAEPMKQETPLLSQLTGFMPKKFTKLETLISKLGIPYYEFFPAQTGETKVDLRAQQLMGELFERNIGRVAFSPRFQALDDAAKRDVLIKAITRTKNQAAMRAMREYGIRRTKRLERFRGAPRAVPKGERPVPPYYRYDQMYEEPSGQQM